MSGLFVAASVDFGDVEQGIDAMERRAHALGPAFRDLKKPMREDQRDHSKKQRGPFGSWARRSPKTIEFYREHGKKRIPRPLGRLPSAVKYTAMPWGLVGESRVAWSAVQQEGGKVGRGVTLKARPFLWLSRKLLDVAENVIGAAVEAAWGKR